MKKILFFLNYLLLPTQALAAQLQDNSSGGKAIGSFDTVFGVNCLTYLCWIQEVWNWTLMIIVPLSVLIISAAGVIYMTAGGDEKRVGTAKKMIWGVLSGVGLIILARVLLINVVGIGSNQLWF